MALEYRRMASPVLISVPFAEVESLSVRLAVASATVLGVTPRTAARRKREGLSKDETDRVLRLTRVFEEAIRVFGTERKAALWLSRPKPMFSGVTPLSLMDTDTGADTVRAEIGRIEYGIFA